MFDFDDLEELEAEAGDTSADQGGADESETFDFAKGDKKDTGASPWLRCLKKNPDHKARLILFSWTGNRGGRGSAHTFQRPPCDWPKMLPDFEMYEINWPGRGMRQKEPCLTDANVLSTQIADTLATALGGGRPFAFLGFAFGSIVAFETAKKLQGKGCGPLGLVCISTEGPAWNGRQTAQHKMSAAAFEKMLRDKGGTDFILQDEGMKKIFVPVIKADVELEEKYAYDSSAPLRCPIVALYGDQPGDDKEKTLIPADTVSSWMQATSCVSASKVECVKGLDWYMLQQGAGAQKASQEVSSLWASAAKRA